MFPAPRVYFNADAELRAEIDAAYPFVPLTAPGIPAPGPDFIAAAEHLVGESAPNLKKKPEEFFEKYGAWLEYLYRRALYEPGFQLNVRVKGAYVPAEFLGGHYWGHDPVGPLQADVMVLGKHPGVDELAERRNFVGAASADLYKAMTELELPKSELETWYVTNLVKHNRLDPGSATLASSWIKNCAPLLAQELQLVQPRFILCLGAEAGKALLGKSVNVSNMIGRVVDYTYGVHLPGEKPKQITAQVMVIVHPAYVFRKPEAYDELRSGFGQFHSLTQGTFSDTVETDICHTAVFDAEHLGRLVDEIVADPDPESRVIAVDAEWHGDAPTEPGAYLRTIQFSHKPKHAINVVLRHAGGEPAFEPNIEAALPHLQRLMKSTPQRKVRIGGHFFRADLPWLIDFGLDVRDEFATAGTPDDLDDAGARTKYEGGWDTGYMLHAVHEAAPSFKLEDWAVRLTGCPRYDVPLQKWKEAYCKAHGIKAKDMDGYGECPEDVLVPYGSYDADVTRRLFSVLNGVGNKPGLLDRDRFGNNSRKAFYLSQAASLAFLEMEMTGVEVDRQRGQELVELYMAAGDRLTAELQKKINWPDFNPNSAFHCRELLFGHELNGKRDKTTNEPVRIRPADVICLDLKPIKTAGKPSKPWERVARDGEQNLYNASCDKEVLGILGQQSDVALALRDVRFIRQVAKGPLRPPATDDDDEAIVSEDGWFEYDGGLLSHVRANGRIHTHFFPVETGRCSSSRPPLQNISKRREADYERILKSDYKCQIRSMLRASPGHVLIEVDYKSAELAMIAWLSQDPTMIEHVSRNMLPEDHPDYLDLHSQSAVTAFRLSCAPTKKGLKEAGVVHLRVAAKNVNFGIPYGRGAEALARQCREEGANVTIAEAEQLRENYFDTYASVDALLGGCRARVSNPGWMCGIKGRYRRFHETDDRALLKEMERSAQNFPVQNGVADCLTEALWRVMAYRERTGIDFKFILQVHDALLFEVPIANIDVMLNDVLPRCMCDEVDIYPTDFDGNRLPGVGPYHLGIDCEVCLQWGERVPWELGRSLGIPDKYLAKPEYALAV